MDWLNANLGTIVCGLVLALLVFILVRITLKSHKKGCHCGCNGCTGCGSVQAKEGGKKSDAQ